jgi:MYXO-CTERM domain-containing protein
MSVRRSATAMFTAFVIAVSFPSLAFGSTHATAIGALTDELEDQDAQFEWGLLGLLGLAGLLGLRRRVEHDRRDTIERDH